MNNKYTLPTAEERLMSFACRTCGVPMPHNHSTCDGCEAEREYARIEAGEKVACDSCGEETLLNPCNECREAEEVTANWR